MSAREKLLSEYIGPIELTDNNIVIGGRTFRQAVGIIGGGTGLEALNAASRLPNGAVIVIDPLVGFAEEVVDQLVNMPSKGESSFDWDFFTEDQRLTTDVLHGLVDLAYAQRKMPKEWKAIEAEFLKHRGSAGAIAERIFFVEAATSAVKPDFPMFDEIELYYPYQTLVFDKSIYSFIETGLKIGGRLRVVTDSQIVHHQYLLFAENQVTSHGRVDRPKGAKKPLSAYDIVNGRNGYYFVNITRTGELTPPSFVQTILDWMPIVSSIRLASLPSSPNYTRRVER